METLTIGELKVTWLRGGNNHLDGGAMFGVVPKELWTKKYPISEGNRIPMRTDPLLVQTEKHLMLIDAGIGNGRHGYFVPLEELRAGPDSLIRVQVARYGVELVNSGTRLCELPLAST